MKGLRRKERESGSGLLGLALGAQMILAAASHRCFSGLWKPPAGSLCSRDRVMPLLQLTTPIQLLLLLDYNRVTLSPFSSSSLLSSALSPPKGNIGSIENSHSFLGLLSVDYSYFPIVKCKNAALNSLSLLLYLLSQTIPARA